jgi:phosphoribosyl 1,2-cyclic phosphodiesterase
MKILQLGNGGGLNPSMTNSSFLIDYSPEPGERNNVPQYILFDCGFNIMQRLIELEKDNEIQIKNITHMFISHTDDDHIGSAQTLIYWNYFKNNKVMSVYGNEEVLQHFYKVNYLRSGGASKRVDILKLVSMKNNPVVNINYNTEFIMTPAFHGVRETNGIVLKQKASWIFISGDTVANEEIEKVVNESVHTEYQSCLFFHDYSCWNAPSKNVHACESDFTIEYSQKFQDNCIKYHTGDADFNKEWRTV